MRHAKIFTWSSDLFQDISTVHAYLPSNYLIGEFSEEEIHIYGEDNAGWTLEYVLDRLASGLIFGTEIKEN